MRKILDYLLPIAGGSVLLCGIVIFLVTNGELIVRPYILATALGVIMAGFFVAVGLSGKKHWTGNKKLRIANVVVLIITATAFVWVILMSLVIQLFQPLALSVASSVLLILGGCLLLADGALQLFCYKKCAVGFACVLCVAITLSTGVIWAKTQPFAEFSNISSAPVFLFTDGEGGYKTFRIPSLISLDYRVLNEKNGFTLNNDVLFATAEGRKNSSKDIGEIDIVGKLSTDNGVTWTALFTLFSVEGEKGKYGNPTVILDRETGLINFLCMRGLEKEGYDYRTFNFRGTLKPDLTFEWQEKIALNEDFVEGIGTGVGDGVTKNTVMVGPGKGIQLKSGRLIAPASNGGNSFAIYSDDHGITWVRGESAGNGNECEVAELSNGELVMVVRANLGVSQNNGKQYQRLSYSRDGGETWYIKTKNTALKTPICMASIVSSGTKLILTYPDSIRTRANLSCAVSTDGGESFVSRRLYEGASGYSCATVTSGGDLMVLAEVGKVGYNECLVFLKI